MFESRLFGATVSIALSFWIWLRTANRKFLTFYFFCAYFLVDGDFQAKEFLLFKPHAEQMQPASAEMIFMMLLSGGIHTEIKAMNYDIIWSFRWLIDK